MTRIFVMISALTLAAPAAANGLSSSLQSLTAATNGTSVSVAPVAPVATAASGTLRSANVGPSVGALVAATATAASSTSTR